MTKVHSGLERQNNVLLEDVTSKNDHESTQTPAKQCQANLFGIPHLLKIHGLTLSRNRWPSHAFPNPAADPVPASFELPDKLPTFLTDIKRENFGLFDGRLVCIDYATTIMDASTRLKKADWRED
ncbi:hypothetical protein IWQ52_002300 [Labrenzia sp. EL_159]|nr:hypothetical protein [Labrenzia sp. EL_159]